MDGGGVFQSDVDIIRQTTTTQGLNNMRGCMIDHAWWFAGRFGALARGVMSWYFHTHLHASHHTENGILA